MGLRDAHENTEQSIKARKHELYAEEKQVSNGPQKPFSAYLNDTPPTPLSLTSKVILWTVAVLVGLLFLAALLAPRSQPPRRSFGGTVPPGTLRWAGVGPANAGLPPRGQGG